MPRSDGFTVIVLTYDRPRSFRSLLQGLVAQRLDGSQMELIVCNNAPGSRLSASPWTATGRLLRGFSDVKIMNSSHNWLCRVRYPLAMLARNDIIVFIDDDVVINDPGFLGFMLDSFASVRSIDVLSCWTTLWIESNDKVLKQVRMNFEHPEPDAMTECDYAGPGICIFDRRILTEGGLLALSPEFYRSDSMWFPWRTAMNLGTRKYYLPSFGRIEFHPQYRRHALTTSPNFRRDLYATYKRIWQSGYVPVLERMRSMPDFERSREAHAARTLRVETERW